MTAERPAVTEIAKWLAAAAGEDRPSPLTWGAAVDCLDGLIADGFVVETTVAATGWPDGMEMIREAREALGLFAGAMPIPPKRAWEEALDRMRAGGDRP